MGTSRDTEVSESQTSRRAVLATTGVGIAGLSGCLGGGDTGSSGTTTGEPESSNPFRNQTLRFSTWSGTNATVFEEEIKPLYEEKTGGTLEVVPGWSEILSRIRAAPADNPPYDLTVTGDKEHYFGVQEDLWEQIDYGNLDNGDVIKPELMREDPVSVPLAYGVMCYAYDNESIGFEPGPWSDLTTEATDVALPGAFFSNSLQMASIVSDELPFDQELYDPDGHDAIFETLESIDTAKYYTGAQDLWTSIEEGVANVGQYFFAYSRKKAETTDAVDYGLSVPDQTTGYIDDYHLVRGTDRKEMAEDFLDFMLSKDIQSTYAENFNLGMVNPETEYPQQTLDNVPLSNDALEDVSFMEWSDVAEYSDDLSERFDELKSNV